MKKFLELTDHRSCMNRARSDEMVFVLLGRDVAAPNVIRFWVEERIRLGNNQLSDPQIVEALACAREMEDSRK